jgi:hypothetical protein
MILASGVALAHLGTGARSGLIYGEVNGVVEFVLLRVVVPRINIAIPCNYKAIVIGHQSSANIKFNE